MAVDLSSYSREQFWVTPAPGIAFDDALVNVFIVDPSNSALNLRAKRGLAVTIDPVLNTTTSAQAVSGDFTLTGTANGHAGGYLAGVMGNIMGAASVTGASPGSSTAGVIGKYAVTDASAGVKGYDPGSYPTAGVVAEMASTGDAALVCAISEGDNSPFVKPDAFIKFDWQGTATSTYTFGIDMKGQSHSGEANMVVMPNPQSAAIQFPNGLWLVVVDSAITANVTTTTAPAGSIGFTSSATGNTRTFKSDGSKWQVTA